MHNVRPPLQMITIKKNNQTQQADVFLYKFCPWNKLCHVPFPKVVKLYDAHVKLIYRTSRQGQFANQVSRTTGCQQTWLVSVIKFAWFYTDRDNVWTCDSSKWDPSPCFTFMANYEYTNQGRESNISNIYNVSKVLLQMSDISYFVR